VLTVVATHVGYGIIGASVPSLAEDVWRLHQVAAVTPERLGLVVFIAVAEELLWRGLLLGALRRMGWSMVLAVLSSAFVYGLAQVGPRSPWLVVAACGLGVVWGALRWSGGPSGGASGGLWRAIVAHLVWTIAILGVVPLHGANLS
jgi:membrane protease YdiL (CAAX protease family)